MRLTGVSSSG